MLVLVVLASSVAEYWLTFSLGVRYLIWGAYFHVWLSSPLIGVGPGNSFVQAQFLSPYGGQYVAHNNYLYLATDFGALGLFGAMWLFGNTVVVMLRRRSQQAAMSEVGAGVLGAVVALAIQSLVDHTLGVIAYRAALLAVLGLAIGLPIGSSVETTPQRQPVKTS